MPHITRLILYDTCIKQDRNVHTTWFIWPNHTKWFISHWSEINLKSTLKRFTHLLIGYESSWNDNLKAFEEILFEHFNRCAQGTGVHLIDTLKQTIEHTLQYTISHGTSHTKHDYYSFNATHFRIHMPFTVYCVPVYILQ